MTTKMNEFRDSRSLVISSPTEWASSGSSSSSPSASPPRLITQEGNLHQVQECYELFDQLGKLTKVDADSFEALKKRFVEVFHVDCEGYELILTVLSHCPNLKSLSLYMPMGLFSEIAIKNFPMRDLQGKQYIGNQSSVLSSAISKMCAKIGGTRFVPSVQKESSPVFRDSHQVEIIEKLFKNNCLFLDLV